MQLAQPTKDAWLEALDQHAIGVLHLPVCGGMSHGRPVDPYVVVVVEFPELFPCELRVVVRDYGIRYSKSMDNVEEDFDCFL